MVIQSFPYLLNVAVNLIISEQHRQLITKERYQEKVSELIPLYIAFSEFLEEKFVLISSL